MSMSSQVKAATIIFTNLRASLFASSKVYPQVRSRSSAGHLSVVLLTLPWISMRRWGSSVFRLPLFLRFFNVSWHVDECGRSKRFLWLIWLSARSPRPTLKFIISTFRLLDMDLSKNSNESYAVQRYR